MLNCCTTKNTVEPFKMTELSSKNFHRGSAYLLRDVYIIMILKLHSEKVYCICNFKIKGMLIEHNSNKVGDK